MHIPSAGVYGYSVDIWWSYKCIDFKDTPDRILGLQYHSVDKDTGIRRATATRYLVPCSVAVCRLAVPGVVSDLLAAHFSSRGSKGGRPQRQTIKNGGEFHTEVRIAIRLSANTDLARRTGSSAGTPVLAYGSLLKCIKLARRAGRSVDRGD